MSIRVLACVAIAIPSVTWASVQHSAWSYGVDSAEEGEAGAELWIRHDVPDFSDKTHAGDDSHVWTGLTVAPLNAAELALYGVFIQGEGNSPTRLGKVEAQVRVQVADWFGVMAMPVLNTATSGAGGLGLLVFQRNLPQVELLANLGGGYDYDSAREGGVLEAAFAASHAFTDSLRANVEAFGHEFPSSGGGNAYIGPGIELDKGHFWGVLNVALGETSNEFGLNARLVMGLLF